MEFGVKVEERKSDDKNYTDYDVFFCEASEL